MRLQTTLTIHFFHENRQFGEGLPLVITGFRPSTLATSGVHLICEFTTMNIVLDVDMALVLGRDAKTLREVANSINRRDEAETVKILSRVLLCQKYGL